MEPILHAKFQPFIFFFYILQLVCLFLRLLCLHVYIFEDKIIPFVDSISDLVCILCLLCLYACIFGDGIIGDQFCFKFINRKLHGTKMFVLITVVRDIPC